MWQVLQIAGRIALNAGSKLWNVIKSPFGQGAMVGAAGSSVVDSVSGGVSAGVDKGKDFISSLSVLGLVAIVVFLTVKKK